MVRKRSCYGYCFNRCASKQRQRKNRCATMYIWNHNLSFYKRTSTLDNTLGINLEFAKLFWLKCLPNKDKSLPP